MRLANFKLDQLKVLPLRAIVAFAARCARRVEHFAQLPEGDPRRERRREAVEHGLSMAEAFARGSDAPLDESFIAAADAILDAEGEAAPTAASAVAQAAHAAASAWHASRQEEGGGGLLGGQTSRTRKSPAPFSGVTADLAALSAFTAAADAFLSMGCRNEEFVDAGLADYYKLVGLKLGDYPELGAPVDPSPEGPLGPL
jgi:hypothetical protein